MRIVFLAFCSAVLFASCDDTRVYEKNEDLEQHVWTVNTKPQFEFLIADTSMRYNIYGNIRNDIAYPYSRLFFTYYLQDSLGLVLKKDLVTHMLFDPKTGAPNGSSGLGDIYDHRVPLIQDHKFPYEGMHKIKFEQFMRKDTLEGMYAIGVRIEKSLP